MIAANISGRLKIWPHTARGLSNVVRRLAPSLRADGFDVSFKHDKQRLIEIEKTTDAAAAKPRAIASKQSTKTAC